jgi:hypothetical protein
VVILSRTTFRKLLLLDMARFDSVNCWPQTVLLTIKQWLDYRIAITALPYMLDKNNNNILYAQGEKGMFATGAELNMEILPAESLEKEENSIVRIHVFKKKKTAFKDDILISRRDIDRLRRYIRENF